MEIKVKKLHSEAKLPIYATKLAAGCDLYTIEELTIEPHTTLSLRTGIAVELPEGYFMLIAPRSSLALKNNLIMPNSIGILDEDYRGEVFVILRNISNKKTTIAKGERIAQAVFLPYIQAKFTLTAELSETERGEGGFGSTGKK